METISSIVAPSAWIAAPRGLRSAKSNFIQALEERGYERRPFPSGYATEQPDHCHGWLLGTRPERPCRRATEQRNELAPPHAAFPPAAMSAQALSSFF